MKMKQKHKNTQRRIEKHLSSLAFFGDSLCKQQKTATTHKTHKQEKMN